MLDFNITPYKASAQLERFIIENAPPLVAVDKAPATFAELLGAYLTDPTKLVVWNGGSERTIFSRPEVNHAFRAWHDSFHLVLGAKFDYAGEAKVAEAAGHVAAQLAECYGLNNEDLQVLQIEVMGQLKHEEKWGVFPDDQASFTAAVLTYGIDIALWRKW